MLLGLAALVSSMASLYGPYDASDNREIWGAESPCAIDLPRPDQVHDGHRGAARAFRGAATNEAAAPRGRPHRTGAAPPSHPQRQHPAERSVQRRRTGHRATSARCRRAETRRAGRSYRRKAEGPQSGAAPVRPQAAGCAQPLPDSGALQGPAPLKGYGESAGLDIRKGIPSSRSAQ